MSAYVVESIESPSTSLIISPRYNFLGSYLAENLLSKLLKIEIITADTQTWRRYLDHLKGNDNLVITQSSNTQNKLDYIIDLSPLGKSVQEVEAYLDNLSRSIANENVLKHILILDYNGEASEEIKSLLKRLSSTLPFTAFYIQDIFGPRVDFYNTNTFTKLLISAYKEKNIPRPNNNTEFYPLFAPIAAEQIINTLSKPDSETSEIIAGPKTDFQTLFTIIKSIYPEVQSTAVGDYTQQQSIDLKHATPEYDQLKDHLQITLSWIENNIDSVANLQNPTSLNPQVTTTLAQPEKVLPTNKANDIHLSNNGDKPEISIPRIAAIKTPSKHTETPVPTLPKDKRTKRRQPLTIIHKPAIFNKVKLHIPTIKKPKHLAKAISTLYVLLLIFILWTIVFPPISILFGGVALTYSAKSLSDGQTKRAQYLLSIGKKLTGFGYQRVLQLQTSPIIGEQAKNLITIADILNKLGDAEMNAIEVLTYTDQIIDKITGNSDGDIKELSSNLYLSLDELDRNLGFLESELNSAGYTNSYLRKISGKDFNINHVRGIVTNSKQIAQSLPLLLGSDKKTTYLVLLQNNMELRPTGGFIGSFALISFQDGQLLDTQIHDVYTADGQLNGHVEPPTAIKTYLGEANWWLRDSNWDPDFTTSAPRAEWFLDKEMSMSVDGVIAIDINVVTDALSLTGPLYLNDYNQEINADNIHSTLQSEIEDDFFPGSRKKANILTALYKELTNQLITEQKLNSVQTGQLVYSSLTSRHIQVFIHDNKVAKSLSNLGWDGGIYLPTCEGNCIADWVGLAEANVGVNKANYFIDRSATLEIGIGEQGVRRVLTINYNNSANDTGLEGVYKNYLRILSPPDTKFDKVTITSSDKSKEVTPEIEMVNGKTEAGILLTVNPQSSTQVRLSWTTQDNIDFSEPGNYKFYWRKQAGTNSDPISVRLYFPDNTRLTPDPIASLTEASTVGYNTDLSTDFQSTVSWTPVK